MAADNFSNNNFNNDDAGQNFSTDENGFNNVQNNDFFGSDDMGQNEFSNFAPLDNEEYFHTAQNSDTQFENENLIDNFHNGSNDTQQIEDQIAQLFDDEFFFDENVQSENLPENENFFAPQNEQQLPMSDFDNQNLAFMQESVSAMGNNVQNDNFEQELYEQDLNNFNQGNNNFNYDNNTVANDAPDNFFVDDTQISNAQEAAFDIAVPEQDEELQMQDMQEQENNVYVPERKFKPLFTQPIPSALDEIRSGVVKPASPISSIAATEKPLLITAAEALEREKIEREAAIKAAKEAAIESERQRVEAEKEQFQSNISNSYTDEFNFQLDFPVQNNFDESSQENYIESANFAENTFDNFNVENNTAQPLNYEEQIQQEPIFAMYDVQKDNENYVNENSDAYNTDVVGNNNVEGIESVEDAFNFNDEQAFDFNFEEPNQEQFEANTNELNFDSTSEQQFDNNYAFGAINANDELNYDNAQSQDNLFAQTGENAIFAQNAFEQGSGEFTPQDDMFANEELVQENYNFEEQGSGEFTPQDDMFANEELVQENYNFEEQGSGEFTPQDDMFANEELVQENYNFEEQGSGEFTPQDDMFANEEPYSENAGFFEENNNNFDGNYSDEDEYSPNAQDFASDDNDVRKFNPQEWDSTLNEEDEYVQKPKKSNALLYIVIIVIALAIIGVAIYFISTSLSPSSEQGSSLQTPSESASVATQSVPVEVEPEPVVTIPVDEWYMQIANRTNALSADFTIETADVDGQLVDARIAEDLQRMIDAGNATGLQLYVRSGYRTYEQQETNYNYQVNLQLQNGLEQAEAEAAAAQISAPPGTSEHNLGLGVDIFAVDNDDYNTATFEQTDEFKWLVDNAANYGFILRYPSDKVAVTGFAYEPWHYRYVGVEQAALIKASGLTLEEYVASATS